jgi:long-chain acyl-CoA synthetase
MVGYYKQPELTAESFTDDGYFRTGDLGELGAGGLLKITGRAKEIFKTAKGKYIAPAPLENRLNAHPMVEMSMVAGVGQPAAFAMVLLAETLRPRVTDPAVRADVQTQMQNLLRDLNSGLADYAQLCMLVIVSEPWSVENRCLTPTMKIKRNHIEALTAPQVERWFADGHQVQWA